MTIAAADLGGRAGKMLDRFPSFMLAPTPDKVLAAVAVGLGRDLDEVERLASAIQRAHRIAVADEADDVLGLAALASLHPADFFLVTGFQRSGMFARLADTANAALDPADPRRIAPPLPDDVREQRGYDAYVDALRTAVRRAIAVLMDGCGTLRALLEGTALLLDAEHAVAGGVVEQLDPDPARGGFLHRMQVRYHVVRDGELRRRRGSIVLNENPLVARASTNRLRRQRERFSVRRGGFFAGPATIRITGTATRTVCPMLVNRTTHEGIGFAGLLADGETLTFETDGTVHRGGVDETARAFHFRGGLHDDPPAGTVPPAWHRATAVVTPPGALDRAVPEPTGTAVSALPVLELPLGDSEWRFSVREGAFDAAQFDFAVHPMPGPDEPAAFSALAPSGRVELAWEEHDPFAVSVLIGSELESLEDAGLVDGDLPSLVRAGLERYRAAGVRVDVSYVDEDWVLGKAVLHDLVAPPGPGVDFNATVISSQATST